MFQTLCTKESEEQGSGFTWLLYGTYRYTTCSILYLFITFTLTKVYFFLFSLFCLHVCCVAAEWCLAGRLWFEFWTVAASATAMMHRMTWCWECASTLSGSSSHTVLSFTRLDSKFVVPSFHLYPDWRNHLGFQRKENFTKK